MLVPLIPQTKPVPFKLTTSRLLQAKAALPKSTQATTLIEAFEKHDQHFADSLNNLAKSIDKLVASIEDSNN